jgi:hypothetical protein
MDAGICAARRAEARRHHLLAGFEASGGSAGSGEEGEEDYDDPEEMFNDNGVPIEPFHLKREREEGYFDEVGQEAGQGGLGGCIGQVQCVLTASQPQLALRGEGSPGKDKGVTADPPTGRQLCGVQGGGGRCVGRWAAK